MHDLLGPLHERLDNLERLVQDLHAQVSTLSQTVPQEVSERLLACEEGLAHRASLTSVDVLAQGLVARFEGQVKALREECRLRPSHGLHNVGEPEVAALAQEKASNASSCSDSEHLEGRFSAPVSLAVAHQSPDSGSSGEVTVEARSLDRVAVVKRRAHEQLSVWYRFSMLGDLDSGDAEPLPPVQDCCLCVSSGEGQQILSDRRVLADCDIEDGASLVLTVKPQKETTSRQPAVHTASRTKPERDEETVVEVAIASCRNGQSLHLIISHAGSQVTLEARPTESIGTLKRRALAQLAVWQRFQALGDSGVAGAGGDGASLPTREECCLYALGPSLSNQARIASCGLVDGAHLELRPGEK